MTETRFKVTYDRGSDVLYLSTRPGVAAQSQQDELGVVWRYDRESGDLIGVTIVDFDRYWRFRLDQLSDQVATRFAVSHETAHDMLASVH